MAVKNEKRSKAANIIIILVLGIWAVAIGAYLAWKNVPEEEMTLDSAPITSGTWDDERWAGIYQGNDKIGYAFSRIRSTDGGYDVWAKSKLRLSLLQSEQEINMDMQARLDSSFGIELVQFQLLSGIMEIKASGVASGRTLDITIHTAGQDIEKKLNFNQRPTLEMNWLMQEKLKDTNPGESLRFSMFEPMTQQELPVTVEVGDAETVELVTGAERAYKCEVKFSDQMQYAWVSVEDGEIIKEMHPGTGLTTLMEPPEVAMDVDWERAGQVDVITSLMVPSNTSLVDPRSVSYLLARLKDAPLKGLDLKLEGRQTLSGQTVEVLTPGIAPGPTYRIPMKKSLPEEAARLEEFLAPTPFIQSDNALIKKAAAKARGDAKEVVPAVENIVKWIEKEIEPSLVVSVPSALEVLKVKRGACKEHTVLFVALARASGIPARTVSGIVYSDQQMIDGFYYHAWPEVFISAPDGMGRWVAVDPTFHQFPADATHIRLKEGGLDKMLNLMQVIGLLKVEVEDYR